MIQTEENPSSRFPSPLPPFWSQQSHLARPLVHGTVVPYHNPTMQWMVSEVHGAPIEQYGPSSGNCFEGEGSHSLTMPDVVPQAQAIRGTEEETEGALDTPSDIFFQSSVWQTGTSAHATPPDNFIGPGPTPMASNPEMEKKDVSLDAHATATHTSTSNTVDHSFVAQSFPLETREHLSLREALDEVMKAPWKINHELEPNGDVLLQFMRYDDGRWRCLFWKDGRSCACSCKKKYHAKGHIRSHIFLFPFVCNEPWYVEIFDCLFFFLFFPRAHRYSLSVP